MFLHGSPSLRPDKWRSNGRCWVMLNSGFAQIEYIHQGTVSSRRVPCPHFYRFWLQINLLRCQAVIFTQGLEGFVTWTVSRWSHVLSYDGCILKIYNPNRKSTNPVRGGTTPGKKWFLPRGARTKVRVCVPSRSRRSGVSGLVSCGFHKSYSAK